MQTIIKKIGTHNGQFHCDEVLACMMLSRYTKIYYNAFITRTRDPLVLSNQDILVDVGGIFNPEKNLYDHHQKEFTESIDNIKLSSAGLIYKYFGKEVLNNIIDKILNEANSLIIKIEKNEKLLELAYERLYKNFIRYVDAIDNGVDQYSEPNLTPNYSINSDLSQRIARLNQLWCETNYNETESFNKAMNMAELELIDQVKSIILAWYPARPFVETAIKQRFEVYSEGNIIKLDQFCPWKDHLFQLEDEMNIKDELKFVLFKESNKSSNWRVQAVPINKHSYENRKGLKTEWRGIKDLSILKKISQIDDIIFCHANGFIGGAASYESALKMAIESLKN